LMRVKFAGVSSSTKLQVRTHGGAVMRGRVINALHVRHPQNKKVCVAAVWGCRLGIIKSGCIVFLSTVLLLCAFLLTTCGGAAGVLGRSTYIGYCH
jgi:hypothetical protein